MACFQFLCLISLPFFAICIFFSLLLLFQLQACLYFLSHTHSTHTHTHSQLANSCACPSGFLLVFYGFSSGCLTFYVTAINFQWHCRFILHTVEWHLDAMPCPATPHDVLVPLTRFRIGSLRQATCARELLISIPQMALHFVLANNFYIHSLPFEYPIQI